MTYWRRAQRPEVQAILVAFHEAGWRVDDTRTYYRVMCPCGDHQRSIHLTPSDPNYGRNALQWLKRQSCDEGGA